MVDIFQAHICCSIYCAPVHPFKPSHHQTVSCAVRFTYVLKCYRAWIALWTVWLCIVLVHLCTFTAPVWKALICDHSRQYVMAACWSCGTHDCVMLTQSTGPSCYSQVIRSCESLKMPMLRCVVCDANACNCWCCCQLLIVVIIWQFYQCIVICWILIHVHMTVTSFHVNLSTLQWVACSSVNRVTTCNCYWPSLTLVKSL